MGNLFLFHTRRGVQLISQGRHFTALAIRLESTRAFGSTPTCRSDSSRSGALQLDDLCGSAYQIAAKSKALKHPQRPGQDPTSASITKPHEWWRRSRHAPAVARTCLCRTQLERRKNGCVHPSQANGDPSLERHEPSWLMANADVLQEEIPLPGW
jgi:hypothetical protein